MSRMYLLGLYATLRRAYHKNEITREFIKQIIDEIRLILDWEDKNDTTL